MKNHYLSYMTLIAEAITAKLPDHYWTLEQYHAMIEAGILTSADRVELLYGKIVPMSPVGKFHAKCVNLITRLLIENLDRSYYVSVQNPISLLDHSEPEPDIVVAKGPADLYDDHHPYSSDVFLLIEVSDTTLSFDRRSKKAAYAAAGIQEYWIVNVFEREIERFTGPNEDGSYTGHRTFRADEEIASLHVGSFLVADLLP